MCNFGQLAWLLSAPFPLLNSRITTAPLHRFVVKLTGNKEVKYTKLPNTHHQVFKLGTITETVLTVFCSMSEALLQLWPSIIGDPGQSAELRRIFSLQTQPLVSLTQPAHQPQTPATKARSLMRCLSQGRVEPSMPAELSCSHPQLSAINLQQSLLPHSRAPLVLGSLSLKC